MIVIISIVAVVALISLYDYFSSRSWQQVTSDTRNDTVFADRNRAYGAYVMRRDYDKRLLLIIAALVGGAGVFYASTRKGKADAEVLRPKTDIVETIIEFKKPEKEPELPKDPAPEQPEQPSGASATFPEPRVSDTDPEPGPLPVDPVAPVGPVIGNPGFGDPTPPNPPGGGGGGGGEPLPPQPPVGPTWDVDEPAQFPGGRPALLAYLGENIHYPQMEAELGIQGKCYLQFVVSKIGDISQVTIQRGVTDCAACDKEAVRVVRSMPNWKPAKKNGKPVESFFNLPVNFVLN